MAIYAHSMDISIREFQANCLELLRRVEAGGEAIDIKRRGRVIARLSPPPPPVETPQKPWERLRGTGTLLANPGESVLANDDFEAFR